MIIKKLKYMQRGYIALSTVLIVLALVLLIGVSTSLLSVNDLQSADSGKQAAKSSNLAEACVQDELMKMIKKTSISTESISLLGSTCSVTLNLQVGNIWDFTVSANENGYYKSIRVNVTRDVTLTINSWSYL